MSGTIGITCTVQSAVKKKELYFKAIDVLETTYSSVKLSYLTNLDKSVNNVNIKTLKEPQPKFTYTAGPFYVTCKSDTNFEYRNNTLIINEECTEIEISNKDITTPAECSISINNPSVKIILNGVNIKNTLTRDAIYASQYRKRIDINLHIKENTTNTIESINTGINLEDTSGGAITGNFLISGDNNDNAKLEIKGNNNYNAILSTAANIKISGGNISIKKVDTIKDLIITGGKTLFKTNTSSLGSYSWSVGGNITIDNAVAVFEAMEPFGKYSLDNTRSSSNITIGKSAVVSGANAFYDATKRCNAGFSTCNTGIEMNKYTILEDGTIFVKEDVEYWQPDGAGEGFIGKDTKMRFKKINLSTGFGLTNNGTIEVQGADVITGAYGRLINNGTIDNYGEIGEVSGYGFGLKNNGVINNYNEAKLYVLENITGSGNINQIATTPETTLILSGQEGIDWVQEADHYLIKNTCTEITLSGSTTKEIRTESGGNDLNIILSNLNAPTSQITFNKDISIYIQKNTINNLKCIYSEYYHLIISANNNIDCILNLEKDNRNSSIAADNIIINNGIINAKGNITCQSSRHLKIELNNGIVNTPRFGGDFDAYTDEIIINNGILFTDIIGCSRDDGSGTKIKFLGGIIRFTEWESYILSEIADSAVITTPNQYIFDELKYKNKGLIIQSQQFTSIDSLKIFDINNETGKITIKEHLELKNSNNSSKKEDILKINENCKVISNGLHFEDAYGGVPPEARAISPSIYQDATLINNGELTINPGTSLDVSTVGNPTSLKHENNGVIYNMGEIYGRGFLEGTGRIIELDLTAEINGELYNDITVDKVNRTVTINNLTPETDYDINLIASLEPYIERSKTIKQRTNEAPPATLMAGDQFRRTLEGMSGFENVTEIRFVQETPKTNGINVSIEGEAKAYIEGNILKIANKKEIFANEDCSNMFKDIGYQYGKNKLLNKITFENLNTGNVINMDSMFYSCCLLTNLNLSSFNTTNVINMSRMFYNCTLLENLNLNSFDTNNVINMSYMFNGCSKLTNLNLNNFNTNNVTDMSRMFENCTKLIDLSFVNININKITDMSCMFLGCSKLTNLNINKLVINNDLDIISMFGYCYKLNCEITIANPNITNYSNIFNNCSTDSSAKFVVNYASGCKEMAQKLVNTKSSNSNVSLGKEYSVLVDGNTFKEKMKTFSNKTIVFENTTNIPEPNGTSIIDLSNTQDKTIVAYTHTYSNETHISSKNIILANEDCSNMFNGSTATKIIFTNFDTRNIKKYNNMFKDCTRLDTDLEITNKNIESYTGMFENASTSSSYKISLSGKKELKSIIDNMIKTKSPSSNIVFSQINILLDGLEFNKKIKSLSWSNYKPYSVRFDEDLKSLNTGTLVDVSKEQDGSIIAVLYKDSWGMSSFKIQSKGKIRASKDASYMFAITTENSSSEAPWLSISTISFPEEMFTETELFVGTFLNWNKLKTINNLNLSKSKVKSMSKMFSGCNELNEFDGYKEYNTLFLSDCSYMFENCNNLPFMQLIRWNTESIVDMTGMFKNANKVNGGIWIKNKNIKTANIADGSHSTLNFYINYTQETKTIANTIVNNSAYGIKIGEDISLLDREKFLDAYKAARYPSEQNSYPIPVNQDEFHRGKAPSGGIDISEAQDGSIIADINDFGLQVYSEKSIMVLDGDSLFPDPRQYSIDPESPIHGSINLSKNFNLTCCENISGMFSHNTSVRSINLTNINTSNVVKANGLFDYCEQSDLEIIGLNNLDFSNLEDAYEMFLMFGTRLDYVQFKGKLSNLKDARKMFSFFHYNELNINLSGNTSDGSYNFEEMFYGGSGRVRLICSDENSIILAKKIQELNSDREILISGGSSN